MSETTGFSPFFLVFGRIPKIPIDVEFGVTLPNLSDHQLIKLCSEIEGTIEMGLQKGKQSKSERSCQAQEIL